MPVFGISISEQPKIYFNHRKYPYFTIKQHAYCGIERCQARTSRAQRNHIFLAISAWFEQHKRRISEKIILYQQNWDVIKNAITEHIRVLLAYPN
nr:hypothetical protein [Candidatus Arsenophonus triatominarum]